MTRTVVTTSSAPRAIGPYSQAIVASGARTLFASGQIPLDPVSGTMVGGGDIKAETEQVLRNLEAVLDAAKMGFEHVVKTTIYLVDLGDFALVNELYGARFPEAPPARATVQVAALPRGARVEIDLIAVAP